MQNLVSLKNLFCFFTGLNHHKKLSTKTLYITEANELLFEEYKFIFNEGQAKSLKTGNDYFKFTLI